MPLTIRRCRSIGLSIEVSPALVVVAVDALPGSRIPAASLLAVASASINHSVNAQSAASPQSTGPQMPADIDPRSGMRLSLPNREDLDDAGKQAYDRGTKPGASIAGLQGPAGIQLFSPKSAAMVSGINRYLRYEAEIGRASCR